MAGAPFLDRGYDTGAIRAILSAEIIVCTIVLSLALGAVEARAAETTPPQALIQTLANPQNPTHDLGDLPPPPDADTPSPASASTVSSAEPVPELPIWTMLLLCFAGLGLARFKRGRKDRLSSGLE
jgi:hypothetical protein